MDRVFYFLKAGVLVLAIGVAGYSSGFNLTKLMGNVDQAQYSAASYADQTMHDATHDVAHVWGKFMSHFRHAMISL